MVARYFAPEHKTEEREWDIPSGTVEFSRDVNLVRDVVVVPLTAEISGTVLGQPPSGSGPPVPLQGILITTLKEGRQRRTDSNGKYDLGTIQLEPNWDFQVFISDPSERDKGGTYKYTVRSGSRVTIDPLLGLR